MKFPRRSFLHLAAGAAAFCILSVGDVQPQRMVPSCENNQVRYSSPARRSPRFSRTPDGRTNQPGRGSEDRC